MFLSTTYELDGIEVEKYHGLVFGETVRGINIVKDIGAGLRNIVGGRASGYEDEVIEARIEIVNEMKTRAEQMGANGIIGIDFQFVAMGAGNMLMVSCSGTAVTIK
ncbi:MAG: YbjQ family protein [Tissierellia bacterium]|nr:YbjQ family protein [Tissierellia bacterium]